MFSPDWRAQVGHPLSQQIYVNRGGTLPRIPPNPKAKNVGPGDVASGKDWHVTAALAEHVQPFLDSLAYRVDTPDGSVVFTGDTQTCQSVIDLARDADMMLCMCWDDQDVMSESGEATGQCGTTGAAQMAQEAGVKKLVLVHMGRGLSAQEPFYNANLAMQRIYQGEIVFSEELLKIDL